MTLMAHLGMQFSQDESSTLVFYPQNQTTARKPGYNELADLLWFCARDPVSPITYLQNFAVFAVFSSVVVDFN